MQLPTHSKPLSFALWLGRQDLSGPTGVAFQAYPDSVQFLGLSGPSPALTYSNFSVTEGNNSALIVEIEADVTGSFSFHSIVVTGVYGKRTVDPGEKSYRPLSYAVPFGVKNPTTDRETFVLFSYQTSQSSDPGRFVSVT